MINLKVKIIDSDKDFKALLTRFNDMKKLKLQVGFPSKAKIKKGSNKGSGRKPTATMSEIGRIAWWNEYGVPDKEGGWRVKPRPFIRPTIDKYENKVFKMLEKGIVDVLHKKGYRIDTPLKEVGNFLVDKMRLRIRTMKTPRLSTRTIENKGHGKLLIDSKQMYNSITYTLENK